MLRLRLPDMVRDAPPALACVPVLPAERCSAARLLRAMREYHAMVTWATKRRRNGYFLYSWIRFPSTVSPSPMRSEAKRAPSPPSLSLSNARLCAFDEKSAKRHSFGGAH